MNPDLKPVGIAGVAESDGRAIADCPPENYHRKDWQAVWQCAVVIGATAVRGKRKLPFL
jgi:hypothetical protein